MSGDVGSVVFDHLPAWLLIRRGGVPKRFLGNWMGFFDDFFLFSIRLGGFQVFSSLAAADQKWFSRAVLVHIGS